MKTLLQPVIGALLAVGVLFTAAPVAHSATVLVDFQFDAPDFAKPELDPLEQLLATNGITQVIGSLSYDTADATFVTNNFSLATNIDALFDTAPDELAFGLTGELNQIRTWKKNIAGTDYILELTGLDPTEPLLPPRWFGGKIVGFPDSVFDLTAANGPITVSVVPLPASFPLVLTGVLGLAGFSRRRRR